MAGALPATDRLRRLLSLVPWIAEHPEGVAIRDVCARFAIGEAQLVKDLEVVMMVGVYPYTPDALIEVMIDQDFVHIRLADYFARPLRLTPSEGLALSAGLAAMADLPGAIDDGVVTRTAAKLHRALGVAADPKRAPIDIDLGATPEAVFDAVARAQRNQHQVEIDYYSADTDERNIRRIEPAQLWNYDGHWYVAGYCHRAGEQRTFRLDRIATANATDAPFSRPVEQVDNEIDFSGSELPRVRIRIAPHVAWMFDPLPSEKRQVFSDGSMEMELALASTRWLTALMVQAGRGVEIVDGDPRVVDAITSKEWATHVLQRYRDR